MDRRQRLTKERNRLADRVAEMAHREAERWVAALPPGQARDQALSTLAFTSRGPQAGIRWTNSIESTATRIRVLNQMAPSLMRMSRDEARRLIEQFDVPLEEKERIETLLGSSRP